MPQDVYFNLYEYFNVKGQPVNAMVVMDSDDPDFDGDSSDPAIEEQLISVVENDRWGRQTNDAPTLVPDIQAVHGLTALVGAVMQESIGLDEVRTVTSVAINKQAPVSLDTIMRSLDQTTDAMTARAIRAVFRGPK